MTKSELLDDWPTAIAIREPGGWAVYGCVENELEMSALLAVGQETESEAWEEACAYYEDMRNEAQ